MVRVAIHSSGRVTAAQPEVIQKCRGRTGAPRRTEVALAKTSEPFDTSFVRQYEWST